MCFLQRGALLSYPLQLDVQVYGMHHIPKRWMPKNLK